MPEIPVTVKVPLKLPGPVERMPAMTTLSPTETLLAAAVVIVATLPAQVAVMIEFCPEMGVSRPPVALAGSFERV